MIPPGFNCSVSYESANVEVCVPEVATNCETKRMRYLTMEMAEQCYTVPETSCHVTVRDLGRCKPPF